MPASQRSSDITSFVPVFVHITVLKLKWLVGADSSRVERSEFTEFESPLHIARYTSPRDRTPNRSLRHRWAFLSLRPRACYTQTQPRGSPLETTSEKLKKIRAFSPTKMASPYQTYHHVKGLCGWSQHSHLLRGKHCGQSRLKMPYFEDCQNSVRLKNQPVPF